MAFQDEFRPFAAAQGDIKLREKGARAGLEFDERG
jgi:hypothetical protein